MGYTHVEHCSIACVRQVDHHSQPVQLRYELAAERSQAVPIMHRLDWRAVAGGRGEGWGRNPLAKRMDAEFGSAHRCGMCV